MSGRTTLILGVVLLVLVAYLVISNNNADETTAEATIPPAPTVAPRTRVIPETADTLTPVRLDVTGTDEDGNLINRAFALDETGAWAQVVPTYTQLISGSIVSQANGMLNISSRQVLPSGENPLSAYGLDAPGIVIVVVADRGGQGVRYTFNIGDEIVGGTGYYLQREGDGRVYVVDRTAIESATALLTSIPVPPPPPTVEPITSTLTITPTGLFSPTVPLTTTIPITSTQ
jgi:hypothetical protein